GARARRRLDRTLILVGSAAGSGCGRERALIAVYGSSTVREGQPAYRTAYDLGQALARAGADVMTGGYGGIMEACSRGAAEAGAHGVGGAVVLFEKRGPSNRWVHERGAHP